MKRIQKIYTMTTLVFVLFTHVIFAQTYKSGEQVEALINNSWQPVKILQLVAGKTDVYNVQAVTATGKTSQVIATYQVKEQNIRGFNKTTGVVATAPTTTTAAANSETGSLHLGKYSIYSGIPFMYIGHFELQTGGNYIVALASDEDSYATGTYTYDAASNTITWKTGFFWQKKWEGKINAAGRIQFNRSTYGEIK